VGQLAISARNSSRAQTVRTKRMVQVAIQTALVAGSVSELVQECRAVVGGRRKTVATRKMNRIGIRSVVRIF